MGSKETYCLSWNDYRSNISLAFQDIRSKAEFFDVTLATEKAELRAHKIILSACSQHLRELLKRHSSTSNPNLVIYLRGVNHSDLEAILEFMYNGVVNVAQENLQSFLSVAEDLKVKGLTQDLCGQAQAPSGSKNIASLNPSANNKSSTPIGHQASAKRLKTDTSLVIKEESKKKMIPGSEVTFPTATTSSLVDDDNMDSNVDNLDGLVGDDDMFQYDETEFDGGDSGPNIVDPAGLGVPGPSRLVEGKEEHNYLVSEILEYLTSMSARREDGQYQCLVCARVSRDLYNQRLHIMTHMVKDTAFLERFDAFVNKHSVQQSANYYTCLICRMHINRGYYMVRQHFFSKHLKEDKYADAY